jgi:hypothetical protein
MKYGDPFRTSDQPASVFTSLTVAAELSGAVAGPDVELDSTTGAESPLPPEQLARKKAAIDARAR